MTYDKHLRDFYDGLNHGYPSGVYGGLGISLRQAAEPYRPVIVPEPEPTIIAVPQNTGHDRKLTWDLPKPETEFERSIRLARQEAEARRRAEERRRGRQLEKLARRPRLWLRVKGHVHSFLDESGRLFLDDGEFTLGEVVPQTEHLRRLRKAYITRWEYKLKKSRDGRTPAERHRAKDAEERLALAKSGLYIAPVNARGSGLMFELFREHRFLRWSWVKRQREYRVGIAEYDRRMRLCFRRALSDEYGAVLNQTIASLNGDRMFRMFLTVPMTYYITPGKDRQFRLPFRAEARRGPKHHRLF